MNRREFLSSAAGASFGAALGAAPRPKVAAVFTEFTYRSHAHFILENFLQPYLFNGRETDPGCDVVSFHADQLPAGRDMAREVARTYQIPIFPTIAGALCLGGRELAVDAVLSIGEHGDYPTNKKGQREYPRKRFFDEIVAEFRRSGRVVPVFNDKHLSYRWDWAREMFDTARAMKFPFMAGSSVPLAQRIPPLEIPAGSKITEAIATHGGGLDSYDFHALEVLQSMVENRSGGETGVARVQYLGPDALWKAADAGAWSPGLLPMEIDRRQSWGIMVHYRDGLRGLALKISGDGTKWHFGCRIAGQAKPLSTRFFVGPWRNRSLFKALSHAIQVHFRSGHPPYPIERTLLTTGIVAAGVDSHAAGDTPIDTPHLDVRYRPTDWSALREMGESWKLVTGNTEEPKGIDRMGKAMPPAPPSGTEGGFNPIRKSGPSRK